MESECNFMNTNPSPAPSTFADSSERSRHPAKNGGAQAVPQPSHSATAKVVSARALGTERFGWFSRLVFTFTLFAAGALRCAAQAITVTVTPCTILTLCNPSASIQINQDHSGSLYYLAGATNWTAGPYNWIFTNGSWANIGGTSPDYTFVVNSDSAATIGRSDNASNQTVKVTATMYYWYLSGGTWVYTQFSPSIPSIEIADSGGCSPGNATTNPSQNVSCSSCNGSAPTLGTANVQNNLGPYAQFNLGAFSYMQNAGAIMLDARKITNAAALSTPAALYVPFVRTNMAANVTVMTNGSGVIQQVNTPQGLVNVAVANAYQYQLQMFYSTNVITNSGSLYTTNGPAFTTWTIANPNGSTNANLLTLTENGGGVTNLQYTYTYTNISGTNQWVLTDSGSNRTSMSWAVANPTNSAITNIYFSTLTTNTMLQMGQKTYVPMTNSSIMPMTLQMDGSGSATNMTMYGYNSSNLVQQINSPNGNWTFNVYDTNNRVITNYSAYGNAGPLPLGSTNVNTATYPCKVTTYNYSLQVTNDTNNMPMVARLEIVSIPTVAGALQEVSRLYRSVPVPTEVDEYRCPTPGGNWSDATNLVTKTVRYEN